MRITENSNSSWAFETTFSCLQSRRTFNSDEFDPFSTAICLEISSLLPFHPDPFANKHLIKKDAELWIQISLVDFYPLTKITQKSELWWCSVTLLECRSFILKWKFPKCTQNSRHFGSTPDDDHDDVSLHLMDLWGEWAMMKTSCGWRKIYFLLFFSSCTMTNPHNRAQLSSTAAAAQN